jgi:hypothetical protein
MFSYVVFRWKLWRLERKRGRTIKTLTAKQVGLAVAGRTT